MKIPKNIKRYCPFCKKHTKQKVMESKKRSKGTTHPLSRGSKHRTKKRGEWRGMGNKGKYSRPPSPKRSGKKLSKKTDLRYNCTVCKKSHVQRKGKRTKKLELI